MNAMQFISTLALLILATILMAACGGGGDAPCTTVTDRNWFPICALDEPPASERDGVPCPSGDPFCTR